MNKELYVSTTPHETKVALVEDDQLAEIYFERENEYTLAGSIYKGRVTRVLPGMQSAFVDIGLDRDAFLYVSDFLELQDEDDDGEFGDVKITGATLAQANGMILAEPLPVEEEDAVQLPDEPVAEAEDAQIETKDVGSAPDSSTPRWRGRRRRRGRRGGRERAPGELDAQPAGPDSEGPAAESANSPDFAEATSEQDADAEAPREPKRRELRGFEPRGLVVHGLSRSVDESEESEPELLDEVEEAPEEVAVEEKPAAPEAVTFTPMLLPGESISKYNRAEGEPPAPAPLADLSASEESDTSYGRSRDRGDRDRGRGGRSGGRDRDRGRGRDREREPREPREHESFVLPENYTPILLPGESISKYRGVEPTSVSEPLEASAPVESVTSVEAAAPAEPIAAVEAVAPVEFVAAVEAVAPVEPVETAPPSHSEPSTDEPLSSASYSGVSTLPSLTQRWVAGSVSDSVAEVEAESVPEVEAEVKEPETAHPEPAHKFTHHEATQDVVPEVAQPIAETSPVERRVAPPVTKAVPPAQPEPEPAQIAQPEAVHAEQAHVESKQPESKPSVHEPVEVKPAERTPARRSWRDRVSKMFGGSHAEPQVEQPAPVEPVSLAEKAPVEKAPVEKTPVEKTPTAKTPDPYGSQLGSFVIEGGHVEHEEFDDEETEMPALAAHRDRYQETEIEDELEDGNGSQFGTAVRETEEENELEDDEYDFGGEEFEESELLADPSVEEEEEAGEPGESEESEVATAPAPGRQRPDRFDRRDRRGRRGAPPQRGGPRTRSRQQSRAVPLISELLKEGQEILVQIAKEPIGKKGARITSHIALPGRFLVYMPTVNHIGVSRKISSDEERQRLKRIVSSERENGHGGFIVRTAAANIKEDELRADIRFLKHLWTEIRTRGESSKSPALIYHDLNLVERILRDQVTSDFSQIWVDNESEYERVVRFASRFQPNLVRRIKLYTKDTPLYEQFGINEEINKSLKSKVWLKSGGYIVINQTEALVAIDINTGKYVGKTARLEDTIVKTNCDAVKEIVRQIRLRDLGGIIVVDFIDMDERKNRQKVMQALEEAMKSDRAPSKILQFNDFGLVAITRKRVKQSLERTLGTPCPYCDSTGFVKSVQTICNEIYVEMRKVRRHVEAKEVILRVNPEVAKELKSGNGKWLQEMEELIGHPVLVKSDAQLHQEKFDMNY